MSQYTAEQAEAAALHLEWVRVLNCDVGPHIPAMLRAYAAILRQQAEQAGGVVSDEVVNVAMRKFNESRNYDGNVAGIAMRAALEAVAPLLRAPADGHEVKVLSHDGEYWTQAKWERQEGAYVTHDAIRLRDVPAEQGGLQMAELAGYVDPAQVADMQKNGGGVSIGSFSKRYGRTVPVYYLRAPSGRGGRVDDRAALLYLMQQFDCETWQCPQCGHAEDTATMDSADYLRQYLKAHPPSALAQNAQPCDGQACVHCDPEHGCKPAQNAQGEAVADQEIGRRWRANSSLEAWFPLTADTLRRQAEEIDATRKLLAPIFKNFDPMPGDCMIGVNRTVTLYGYATDVVRQLEDALHAERARVPEQPLPMDTAPRDGTMLRLLVQFEEHATEDTAGPAWTIGANEFDANGDDEWRFAGWCWAHDHFTQGKGTPVGWLPMFGECARVPADDWRERERLALRPLFNLLRGFQVRVEYNTLQPPATYLDEVILSCEFQPGQGRIVAENLRSFLAAEMKEG